MLYEVITLAAVLDGTATAMGSRLLKRWIHQPIRQPQALQRRQHAIGELLTSQGFESLPPLLKQIGDMERILARLALRSARPRDLLRLRLAFEALPQLQAELAQTDGEALQGLRLAIGEFPALCELLQRAIIDNPPVVLRDGGVIANGYDAQLDELRDLANGATAFLEQLEVRERQRTGINTLKVDYNKRNNFV